MQSYHSKKAKFSEDKRARFGDDIRDIDWNVTALSNYIKVFEEEREYCVMVDVSVVGLVLSKQMKEDMITEFFGVAFRFIQKTDGVITAPDRMEVHSSEKDIITIALYGRELVILNKKPSNLNLQLR